MRTSPTASEVGDATLSGHAVSWAAIFAGAVVAAGVSLILVLIGTGFGLAVATSWVHPGGTVAKLGAATIIWLAITQLIASGLGGYLAGRLRAAWPGLHTHEAYFRDTSHGLITWALATLAVATIFASTTASIAGGTAKEAASAVGGAGQTAITAGAAVGQEHASSSQQDTFGSFADRLLRSTESAVKSGGPSESGNSSEEVARILSDSVQQGGLSQDDRQYLGQLVARRTGLSQQEAEQRVTATYAAMQARLDAAKEKAKQAADDARKATAAASLWFAITLLIGAFVASWAATFGGRLRDKY
jgi:hypothetical protein